MAISKWLQKSLIEQAHEKLEDAEQLLHAADRLLKKAKWKDDGKRIDCALGELDWLAMDLEDEINA